MTDLLDKAITAVFKIVKRVKKVQGNDEECIEICHSVERLRRDLMLLKGATIMDEESVSAAMGSLKDTLETTEARAQECKDAKALVRFFNAEEIATKLNKLRQDISERMLAVVTAASRDTNKVVHRTERKMDQGFDLLGHRMDYNTAVTVDTNKVAHAILALLQPLGCRVDPLEQHQSRARYSTDDSSNENKTETKKTGYKWSFLAKASKGDNIIGRHHSSSVYKAELNNEEVAIKKFDLLNANVRARFVDELRLVSKLQHENIVKHLGYCYEYSESLVQEGNDVIRVRENGHLALVSRYMSNESLIRVIEGNDCVDWPSVFRIIHGIAKGVRYLHEQGVLHLDLKPKTILLDADMNPKINDFEKARVLERGGDEITLDIDNLPGTKGYMAPELLSKKPTASTKSDVYSFGIILLETISLMCAGSKESRPKSRKEWETRMQQDNELDDLFNSQLRTDEFKITVAKKCLILGLLCCVPEPKNRPSMQDVVDTLAGSCTVVKESANINTSAGSQEKGKEKQVGAGEASSRSLPDESKITSARNKERSYEVLTQDDLRARQKKDTEKVCEILSVSTGVATVLLRHCHWIPNRVVQLGGFENMKEFCDVVGLTMSSDDVISTSKVLWDSKRKCKKCKKCHIDGSDGAGRTMRSAGCAHYYCNKCWRVYIDETVGDGDRRCLSLRCPDQSCQAPVVRSLVVNVVMAQYDLFALRSYVDDSGDRIKWCRGGCGRAVEFLGDSSSTADMFCDCGHGFCWSCLKDPHWPVSCAMARDWLDLLDKNNNKKKNKSSKAWPDNNNKRCRNQYERWEANHKPLKQVLEEMDQLNKGSLLSDIATAAGIEVTALNFLTEAYEEIVECRRVIGWVYVYGYFLVEPAERPDEDKWERFNKLQNEASLSLELLHLRSRIDPAYFEFEVSPNISYKNLRKDVMELTRKTRQDFERLVKAVRTNFQDY